jgi:hypothetical protein
VPEKPSWREASQFSRDEWLVDSTGRIIAHVLEGYMGRDYHAFVRTPLSKPLGAFVSMEAAKRACEKIASEDSVASTNQPPAAAGLSATSTPTETSTPLKGSHD